MKKCIKILETEAIRIMSILPKFTPGKHKGKTVNGKYGLPIIFKMMEFYLNIVYLDFNTSK